MKLIGVKNISSKMWIKGILLVYLLETSFEKDSYKILSTELSYQCIIYSEVESPTYAFFNPVSSI